MSSIPLEDLRFAAVSDASFAFEKTERSHQGMIVAARKAIGDNEFSSIHPLACRSRKTQKVAVSILATESMALAGAVDMPSESHGFACIGRGWPTNNAIGVGLTNCFSSNPLRSQRYLWTMVGVIPTRRERVKLYGRRQGCERASSQLTVSHCLTS